MIKTGNAKKYVYLFFIASVIEITSYYFFGEIASLIIKIFPTLSLFFYYYLSSPFPKKNFDKFLLGSIIFTFFGEIAFSFSHIDLVITFALFFYLIEHQIYIRLVRSQRKGEFYFGSKDFFKFGWPYLLFAFLFFGFFLMEIVPDSFFFLVLIYVFQFAILGVFSILISSENPGKNFLLWGIALNVISDILSSFYLFQNGFNYDYLLIRATFLFSKFLIVSGFIEGRKHVELKYRKY